MNLVARFALGTLDRIGMAVRVVFERLDDVYLPLFEPDS